VELVSRSWPKIERLLDEQRLVEEIGIGIDQRLRHPVCGEVGEGEKRLQPRDATVHDDNAGAFAARVSCHLGPGLARLDLPTAWAVLGHHCSRWSPSGSRATCPGAPLGAAEGRDGKQPQTRDASLAEA
jgi:hypothetical protein